MMAMQKDYHNISNNMVSLGGVLDSLESVHDTIHNTVGSSGPGHMTNAAYSAFDPVFWLLHANIDRMTTIWQTLNPDSWVTNNSNPTATFTSAAGAYADEDTPLHPFHRSRAGDFWTSASVRDHTIFGYTYPELVGLSADDTLVMRVNRLYGNDATSQFSWKLGDPVPSTSPKKGYIYNDRRSIQVSSPQEHNPYQYQYFANIKVRKSGSEGGYKVFVFLGFTDAATAGSTYDATVWMRNRSFVGFTGFQTMGYAGDASSTVQGDANGVVAMTNALEDRLRSGELASMDEETVEKYLYDNMSWRITTVCRPHVFCWLWLMFISRLITASSRPRIHRVSRSTSRTQRSRLPQPPRSPRCRTAGSSICLAQRAGGQAASAASDGCVGKQHGQLRRPL